MPRLFGTDGVRGKAGQFPLDHPTVRRLGAAVVRALPAGTVSPRLLVGRDTRESGSWIEAELAHGASGEGATVVSAGVVPTPAVAYLTRSVGYDLGIVISASHNPFEDNGIKVFSGKGEKFTEDLERHVEGIMADPGWRVAEGEARELSILQRTDAYLNHLRTVFPEVASLGPFKLAIDCANGAVTPVAPQLFMGLGIELVVMADEPDGHNINLQCGSTHPETLASMVVERQCDMGVAFDGDGDRAIFVDDRGGIVNGDAVLLMCARQLQREHRLAGSMIVATVMSNIGLELACRASGIDMVRTAVGDKYVMEEMLRRGATLGGEQSGHVIFSDYLFTGDGLCTALSVLRTVAMTGRSLADLAADLTNYPQVLLNVRVREKVDLHAVPDIAAAIKRVEERVDGHGRVLVRYSGTEPLLRVMIEGRNEGEIRAWAQEIVDVVQVNLGI
ncbi:MAG TPA: phosphoglucosamine mutase [Vicinamibacterales bacterium]|nr:phosphoglucosamine mutase [Vicinamibacterales bacterium]